MKKNTSFLLILLSVLFGTLSCLFACSSFAFSCSDRDSYALMIAKYTPKTPYSRSLGKFSVSSSEKESFSAFRRAVFEFTYGYSNAFRTAVFSDLSITFLDQKIQQNSCDNILDYLDYDFASRNDSLLYLSTGSLSQKTDFPGVLISDSFADYLIDFAGLTKGDYSQLVNMESPLALSFEGTKISVRINGVFPERNDGLNTLSIANSCLSEHFGNFVVFPEKIFDELCPSFSTYLSFSEIEAKNIKTFSLAESYFKHFENRLSFEKTKENEIVNDKLYSSMADLHPALISFEKKPAALSVTIFSLFFLLSIVFLGSFLILKFFVNPEMEKTRFLWCCLLSYFAGLLGSIFLLRHFTGGRLFFEGIYIPIFNHLSLAVLLGISLYFLIFSALSFYLFRFSNVKK